MKLPTHVLAEEWPSDPSSWVIRLTKPVLMARVEPRLPGHRLHCWPSSARLIDEKVLHEIVGQMLHFWESELDGLADMPEKWEYVFDQRAVPPAFLHIESGDLEAIYETATGLIWKIAGGQAEGATVAGRRYWREFLGQKAS